MLNRHLVLSSLAVLLSGQAATCNDPDADTDGWTVGDGDCDDSNPEIHPGAEEVCNGVDDNCDLSIDEGLETTWYADGDGDGDGDPAVSLEACMAPDGYVAEADDCNDADASVVGGTSGCPWSTTSGTCLEVLEAGEDKGDGVYALELPGGTTSVYCDMTTDGGGWSLVASYRSDLGLYNFDHTQHQVQSSSGGETLSSAPDLSDDSVSGHIAYTEFPSEGRELKLGCRTSTTGSWYEVSRADVFNAWEAQDYGTYGSTSGWGIIGSEARGRSNHFICGYAVNTSYYPGIAYCSGSGASGSWSNHQVSFSFTRSADNYGGGLSIGCNGTGQNTGTSSRWDGRVWIR